MSADSDEYVPSQEDRLRDAILDIDAHATPYGEDEDGYVNGGYLISVGSLHRALGVVGHSMAKCKACEARDHDCKALVNETNEPVDPLQAVHYYRTRLVDAMVRIVEYDRALRTLVDLKDGPHDSGYLLAKPKAWDDARRVLDGDLSGRFQDT